MEINNNDRWINIDEAAEYLGVNPATIRNWLRNGNVLPARKIGRMWKFKKTELDEWIKSGDSANIQ